MIRLIAKGYAQIVLDVSVDVSDVSEALYLKEVGNISHKHCCVCV